MLNNLDINDHSIICLFMSIFILLTYNALHKSTEEVHGRWRLKYLLKKIHFSKETNFWTTKYVSTKLWNKSLKESASEKTVSILKQKVESQQSLSEFDYNESCLVWGYDEDSHHIASLETFLWWGIQIFSTNTFTIFENLEVYDWKCNAFQINGNPLQLRVFFLLSSLMRIFRADPSNDNVSWYRLQRWFVMCTSQRMCCLSQSQGIRFYTARRIMRIKKLL